MIKHNTTYTTATDACMNVTQLSKPDHHADHSVHRCITVTY